MAVSIYHSHYTSVRAPRRRHHQAPPSLYVHAQCSPPAPVIEVATIVNAALRRRIAVAEEGMERCGSRRGGAEGGPCSTLPLVEHPAAGRGGAVSE